MPNPIKKTKIKHIFLLLFTIPFAFSFFNNFTIPLNNVISLLRHNQKDVNISQYRLSFIVNTLSEIAKMPIDKKKKTLLWIPKSNQEYWNSMTNCRAIPFIAPSLTGIAMLDGVLPENCQELNYGYSVYKNRKYTPLSPNPDQNELCRATLERGFSQLIILKSNQENTIEQIKLQCQ